MKPYFRDRQGRGPMKKIKNKYRQELAVTERKKIVNHEPFPEMAFKFSFVSKYIFVEKGSADFIRNAS